MYKILIVDDERMIRLGIERTIQWEKLKIGQVFTAASAQQAIHIIQQTRIPRHCHNSARRIPGEETP